MIVIWLIAVSLCALLFILLGHSGWHGWHIDHEIRPIEVLTLAVNFSVALILQYFLASRATNLRIEKDLIIEDAKAVICKIRDSDEFFSKRLDKQRVSKTEWQISVAQCRAISNALEHLTVSLRSTKCPKCGKLNSECESLKGLFFQYKAAVTNDAPNSNFRPESIRDQARTFASLLKGVQLLIFDINRH
jgi:hypothetical protein